MSLSKLLLATTIAAALGTATSATALAKSPTAKSAAAAKVTVDSKVKSQFDALTKEWYEQSMLLSPINATQQGDHRYDDRIDDLSAAGRNKGLAFSKNLLARLDKLPLNKLSREDQVDALILKNDLRSNIFSNETLQAWAWDPQIYSGIAGSAIYGLMARDYAPIEQRMQSAITRIALIPQILQQARENLDPARVPKTHAETVARQNQGLLDLIDNYITPNMASLNAADQARMNDAVAKLKVAVDEHQKWLDGTLVPNAKGDFRLGAKLYDQKLKFSLNSELSRQEIGRRAEAEMTRVRKDMYSIAQKVLKDRKDLYLGSKPTEAQQQKAIEAALELAYADKPARDDLVPFAKQTLQEATEFVRTHNLMTMPEAPVEIILMPKFQQGFAVAYADSPGPLDKAQKTFYAVSPIPEEWTDTQVDSFLREYNKRMIHLLSIHEAMPGHYLEGAFSAQNPSLIRAVNRSGLFAEGWAVYTEDMMRKAGYLNNDPLFHLVQLKFYLRTISNSILDQGVHVNNWTREQAMDLMTRRAFQQEREAAGKWVRAQLSSTQLPTYFVGVQEQYDMRRAAEKAWGKNFKLKEYHDKVLSYGAPAPRFVRELMLGEPIR